MKNMFVVLNFNNFIMDFKVYKTYKIKKKKEEKTKMPCPLLPH